MPLGVVMPSLNTFIGSLGETGVLAGRERGHRSMGDMGLGDTGGGCFKLEKDISGKVGCFFVAR